MECANMRSDVFFNAEVVQIRFLFKFLIGATEALIIFISGIIIERSIKTKFVRVLQMKPMAAFSKMGNEVHCKYIVLISYPTFSFAEMIGVPIRKELFNRRFKPLPKLCVFDPRNIFFQMF